jgi:endoglycosylceramidase
MPHGRLSNLMAAAALASLLATGVAGAAPIATTQAVLPIPITTAFPVTGTGTITTEAQANTVRTPGLADPKLLPANTYVSGALSSLGGPYLTDGFGRVVTLRGVNAVYKRAPYTLTVKPGRPNSLTAADAKRISSLGFDVVRVGVIWAGIEPGHGGANQPKVCGIGPIGDPGMWNQSIAERYLAQVKKVVDVLGAQHIYSLIDMHQDVWSAQFSGEGAPDWATCTSGHPIKVLPGRWSNNYGNPAVLAAFGHFFANDVRGGLQQQYQRAWTAVASTFASNPWVVGYDPINEPFDVHVVDVEGVQYANGLACLYGGSGGATRLAFDAGPMPCPAGVPADGVVQAIEAVDPTHLSFIEEDNATHQSAALGTNAVLIGAYDLPRIVFNVHDYCGSRSGKTGNATARQLFSCSEQEVKHMTTQYGWRITMESSTTPHGPAQFMSEYGATNNLALSAFLASDTGDIIGIGWAWWSWRYYHDPTGSSAEALIDVHDQYSAATSSIVQPYATAIAGDPFAETLNLVNGQFVLTYLSNPTISAPTVIFIPQGYYKTHYCVAVAGGIITSIADSPYVTVVNVPSDSQVSIRILPRSCVTDAPVIPYVPPAP